MLHEKKKVKKWLGAGVLIVNLVLAGCGGSKTQETASNEKQARDVLIVAQGADPRSLDPHGTNDSSSANVMSQIYNTLVYLDENMEIQPSLATSWEVIDELTIEFKLRDDVTFHNGEKFTAEDVKYTFLRASESAAIEPIVGPMNPEAIEVIDDYTIRLATKEPFQPFLAHLAHNAASIVNEKAMEEFGEDAGRNPVGTGPYKFVSWTSGDNVELVRNDDFFGEKAKMEKLIIRTIIETSSRAVGLETGEIDIVLGVNPTDVERLNDIEGITVHKTDGLSTSHILLNTEKEPFDKVEVRKAVNHAINADEIIQSVLEGTVPRAVAPIAPLVWASNPNLELYEYNIEKAKELLAEAGLADGFKTTLLFSTGTVNNDLATVIKNQLSAVGIHVELQSLEWGTYIEALDNGEQEMALLGWTSVTADPDYGLYPVYHSSQKGAAGNFTFFEDKEVDKLLDEGRKEIDEERRRNIYYEAQERIFDLAPNVWLNHGTALTGVRDDLDGLILHPRGMYDFSKVEVGE